MEDGRAGGGGRFDGAGGGSPMDIFGMTPG